jgi:hypothetical protein
MRVPGRAREAVANEVVSGEPAQPHDEDVGGVSEDDPQRYGRYFWVIETVDGGLVRAWADRVETGVDGSLTLVGGYQSNPDEEAPDGRPMLVMAAGTWRHAFAASVSDGRPVAVESWKEREPPPG